MQFNRFLMPFNFYFNKILNRLLKLSDYGGKIKYAQFLHDGSEIKIGKRYGYGIKEATNPNDVYLEIPIIKPNSIIPVIELVLNE